jgi:hypothetical protein
MLLFIDDATRYMWCYILERKSDAETKFRERKAEMLTKYNLNPKRFRTDSGGEFTSKQFLPYLRNQGIRKETTCHGYARTCLERTRIEGRVRIGEPHRQHTAP